MPIANPLMPIPDAWILEHSQKKAENPPEFVHELRGNRLLQAVTGLTAACAWWCCVLGTGARVVPAGRFMRIADPGRG